MSLLISLKRIHAPFHAPLSTDDSSSTLVDSATLSTIILPAFDVLCKGKCRLVIGLFYSRRETSLPKKLMFCLQKETIKSCCTNSPKLTVTLSIGISRLARMNVPALLLHFKQKEIR